MHAPATRRLTRLDEHLFRRLTSRPAPAVDRIVYPLSRSADGGLLWLGIAGVAVTSRSAVARRAAVRGTAALTLTSIVANLAIKPLVRRDRPAPMTHHWQSRPYRMPRTTSFPSGHAACAAAFAVGASTETAWATPLLGLAAAVGYSRVRTGVHYPLDVAAGFAVGTAVALAGARWWTRHSTASDRYEPRSGGGDQFGT